MAKVPVICSAPAWGWKKIKHVIQLNFSMQHVGFSISKGTDNRSFIVNCCCSLSILLTKFQRFCAQLRSEMIIKDGETGHPLKCALQHTVSEESETWGSKENSKDEQKTQKRRQVHNEIGWGWKFLAYFPLSFLSCSNAESGYFFQLISAWKNSWLVDGSGGRRFRKPVTQPC